jgi:ribosomal protein L11 methyltransferase
MTRLAAPALVELSFDLGTLDAEAAEAACFACGAGSVTFVDAQDEPVLEPLPGEFRLWRMTRVKALFADVCDPDDLASRLSTGAGVAVGLIRIERVPERVWEREWLRDFHAMRFGKRLWICPHHEHVEEPDAVVVQMDPGLAFGTGTHPTTALCLEWLDANLEPGAVVIDYGCGSGVLAVAAVKLGAREAHCFDIDAQALLATRDNAEANGLGSRVRTHTTASGLPQGVDVLVSNILSGPLCGLAPRFASLVRPQGTLVLAGLLQAEGPEVTRAYGACFDMGPFGEREGWLGLSGRRRSCTPSAPSAP